MTFQNILGLISSVLSMLFIWPQVILVYRRNTVEGLAPFGSLQGIAGGILWFVYGLSQGDIAVFGSNLLITFAVFLIAFAMVRHSVLSGIRLYGTIAVFGAFSVACVAVSPTATGLIAFVVGASSVLPQTFATAKADDLSGVSLPTYVLLFFTSLSWFIYGFVVGDTLVVLPNVIVMPCAVFIGAKVARSQSQLKTKVLADVS